MSCTSSVSDHSHTPYASAMALRASELGAATLSEYPSVSATAAADPADTPSGAPEAVVRTGWVDDARAVVSVWTGDALLAAADGSVIVICLLRLAGGRARLSRGGIAVATDASFCVLSAVLLQPHDCPSSIVLCHLVLAATVGVSAEGFYVVGNRSVQSGKV